MCNTVRNGRQHGGMKCKEIEELERKHKTKEMHAKVKEMSTKKGSKSGTNVIRFK